jgi:hypothetical protein
MHLMIQKNQKQESKYGCKNGCRCQRIYGEVLGSLFYGPERVMELVDENSKESKDHALTFILEGMVASGAATHRYDVKEKVDEFSCTERLIQNWGWVFPGDTLGVSGADWYIIHISGDRSRFFNSEWLVEDKEDPTPWPTQ